MNKVKKEKQYKFRIKSKKDFLRKAADFNMEFSKPVKYNYTYFDKGTRNKNSFVSLRLKESADRKSLDMKIRDPKNHDWRHFETNVSDMEQTKNILENLGFKPFLTLHKIRRTSRFDSIRIDLDDIRELGTFLEIKFSSIHLNKVEKLILNLGLDNRKRDTRSISEIYFSKK